MRVIFGAQRPGICTEGGMKQNVEPALPKGRQTNLAEGERDIVEASIRSHEQKGDLKTPGSGNNKDRKRPS